MESYGITKSGNAPQADQTPQTSGGNGNGGARTNDVQNPPVSARDANTPPADPNTLPPVGKTVYDFFIQKGFANYQAAAWVGNLKQESQLNAKAVNPMSGAYGLAQWLGPRKKALFRKPNYDNLQSQLNFIWEELNSTERSAYSKIRQTKNLAEATVSIRAKYERPGRAEANDRARIAYAKAALKKYAGITV